MLHYQIDRVEHQVSNDRSQTGVFLIGPLERGQATTLGNALRRVLIGGLVMQHGDGETLGVGKGLGKSDAATLRATAAVVGKGGCARYPSELQVDPR